MSPSKPLKTESTMISAAVPIVTPMMEMREMIFMTRCDFRLKKYLVAIWEEIDMFRSRQFLGQRSEVTLYGN